MQCSAHPPFFTIFPGARRGALLIRDRHRGLFLGGPGSAAHSTRQTALRVALRPGHSARYRERLLAEAAAIVIAIKYSPQQINAIFMLLFKSILDPAG
jgi:hypothetical protein